MRRTKDQAEATRCALLDAAEAVFFARGVSNASLEEIAREAGVTRGALYWHFKDKAALYSQMLERVRLPLDDFANATATEDDPLTTLERYACDIMRFVGTNKNVQRVYSIALLRREHLPNDAGLDDIEREMRLGSRRAFQTYMEQAKTRGLLHEEIDPELAALGLQSYLVGTLHIGMQESQGFCFADHGVRLMTAYIRSLRRG